MTNLLVRDIDEAIVSALKIRASQHGISAEAEHRYILEQALLCPRKKSFVEVLDDIPRVGKNEDFARAQQDSPRDVVD